ncbi:MAG TPA: hypothetical protein VF529_02235 [Solirubrobacteraceae bacterium]
MSVIDEAVRAIVRDEIAQVFGRAAGATYGTGRADAAEAPPAPIELKSEPPIAPPLGLDGYSLVPYAEYVLREEGGGPLDCATMARRIYALGFRHKRPPKYRDQLERSLNSLASPSQHPDKFERVAPRVLRLK